MTMALLTTNTSSNAATSSFTSSIDNTYKVYVFRFYDVNPVRMRHFLHLMQAQMVDQIIT